MKCGHFSPVKSLMSAYLMVCSLVSAIHIYKLHGFLMPCKEGDVRIRLSNSIDVEHPY